STPSSTVSGTSTTYSPQSGLRWQWTDTATLSRGLKSSSSFPDPSLTTKSPNLPNEWLSDWAWKPSGQNASPWTSNTGEMQTDSADESNAFTETITATASSSLPSSIPYYIAYTDGMSAKLTNNSDLIAYAPYQYLSDGLDYNNFGSSNHINYWNYYYPLSATLILTNS